MKVRRSVNERRSSRRWWILPVVAVLGIVSLSGGEDDTPTAPTTTQTSSAETPLDLQRDDNVTVRDRAVPPTVAGTRLALLDEAERAPLPAQWADDLAPVPFSQWWSGLANGPGIPALWAQPLLMRMNDEGRVDLSAPTRITRADGFRDAEIVPAVFFEFAADSTVRLIDHGSFHVRFVVSNAEGDTTFTMIQGSPFVEIEGDGTVTMTVPALGGLDSSTLDNSTVDSSAGGASVDRFSSAAGPWLLASSDDADLLVDGDRLVLELTPGVRHAIGPAPVGTDERYDQAALTVASDPLITTYETLAVAADGSVEQVLHQQRSSATPVAWSLLPHHEDALVGDPETLRSVPAVYGPSTIVLTSSLSLTYPAIPIVWDAVAPEGFDVSTIGLDDLPPAAEGSYFGAKVTATDAVVHDILRAAGAGGDAERFLDAARDSLGTLLKSGSDPQLTWEPNWGSVVVSPPEFGAGTNLNDHQLQNGYWVGAAASVVVADPTQRNHLQDGIDLLIADYAGSNVVPHLAGVVPAEGTWSSFAGHSWASGIGGFAAGNNLESVSESSYAWWAAAKWFLATNRPELADAFVARLTIESWLTGYQWLPTAANQSSDPTVRPWSGVVWASKNDPGTWFDGSNESALGIRLLPVGPQSFSRYPDDVAVDAAQDRWDWCDVWGNGCGERWWNLLDADAAVAGRPTLPTSDIPEESTTELVRQWWRAHWETTSMATGWSCPPGTTVRQTNQGGFVALVTNPSAIPLTVTCEHDRFPVLQVEVEARTSTLVPVDVSS